MKKFLKISVIVVILGVIFFFGISIVSGQNQTETNSKDKMNAANFNLTYKIVKKDLGDSLDLSGNVTADVYKIIPKITEEIKQVYVKEGQRVKKDDLLIKIDDMQPKIRHLQAYYDYENSATAAPLIRRQKKFELEKAQNDLSYTSVKAPVSGIIKDLAAKKGEWTIEKNQIATIVDTKSMKIKSAINEIDIRYIKKGCSAVVEFDQLGAKIEGHISFISSIAETSNGLVTIPITIVFDEDPEKYGVIPGMTCRVKLSLMTKRDIITVPKEAVSKDKSGEYVMIQSQTTPKKAYVKTGERSLSMIELISGVKEGDILILSPDENVPPPKSSFY